MKTQSTEQLTDQLMVDLSKAVRAGGQTLTTLRKQGYIISAKELDVLMPNWRASEAQKTAMRHGAQKAGPQSVSESYPIPPDQSPEMEIPAEPEMTDPKPYRLNGDWLADGACQGADWLDLNPPTGGMTPEAEDICGNCTVRLKCLEYALASPDEAKGIWGGVSENERNGITKAYYLQGLFEFEPGIFINLRTSPDDPYRQIGEGIANLLDIEFRRPVDIRDYLTLNPDDQAA